MGNGLGFRVAGLQPGAEDVVQFAQPAQVHVQHRHIGAEPHGRTGRLCAHRAAAYHCHFRRRHTGHSGNQHAAASLRKHQGPGARLDGQSAGDLGHGHQQGQIAAFVRDGFVGDADGAHPGHRLDDIGTRHQMQIGEQHLVVADELECRRLRFLHFQHQVGVPGVGGGRDDAGAHGLVRGVGEAGPQACAFLHHHVMAGPGERGGTCRREAHAVFVVLRFLWNADAHGDLRRRGQARNVTRHGLHRGRFRAAGRPCLCVPGPVPAIRSCGRCPPRGTGSPAGPARRCPASAPALRLRPLPPRGDFPPDC